MADPLTTLRDFTSQNRTIKEIIHNDESYYIFGDMAYPKLVDTNLTPNEFYNLEALLFLWNRRDINHTNYVKEAAGANVRAITRIDRKEIMDYLSGNRDEIPSNHINLSAPPVAPIPARSIMPEEVHEPAAKRPAYDHKEKEKLNQLLNRGDKEMSELRPLGNNITSEKVAELRKKRQNNLKRNIAQTADDELKSTSNLQLGKMNERVYKTSENVMLALGNRDFSRVLEILDRVKQKEQDARSKAVEHPQHNSSSAASARAIAAVQPSQRKNAAGYSRYDQEIFVKDKNTDFLIDGEMSFVGSNLNAIQQGGVKKPGMPPPAAQPLRHIPSVHNQPAGGQKPKRSSRTPIIIVPGALTSLITIYNAKDILEDMKFVSTEEKRAQKAQREPTILVNRKKEGNTVQYRVIDDPTRLNEEDWDRIVGVFVHGPAWQFKGWKWGGNPVQIFSQIQAFHLYFDDMKMEPNVAKWNVEKIPVARTKRYLDKANFMRIWEKLESHIMKNKPQLRF
ncbi:hypothetical protein WR25_02807 [Diploscapter pachys]|uniref:Cell division control protein 73 C-terminal domain-containing protein n=1 Tax=Diploscapter pachys TaxID=2018661 RepID=A0A2A2LXY8_9BILA|nr:hypothetical protein WR25_02807 [Diploscapter pachys]